MRRAKVKFHSSTTTATYYLNVEIRDCKVIVIHFPNGGYVDESHFTAREISNGEVSFKDDLERYYDVYLDYGLPPESIYD